MQPHINLKALNTANACDVKAQHVEMWKDAKSGIWIKGLMLKLYKLNNNNKSSEKTEARPV